jgi:hypothetical protein
VLTLPLILEPRCRGCQTALYRQAKEAWRVAPRHSSVLVQSPGAGAGMASLREVLVPSCRGYFCSCLPLSQWRIHPVLHQISYGTLYYCSFSLYLRWCRAIMRGTRWHVMPHWTALLIVVLPVVRTKNFFRSASESTEPEKDGMLVMRHFP